jgi:hypothetical protein
LGFLANNDGCAVSATMIKDADFVVTPSSEPASLDCCGTDELYGKCEIKTVCPKAEV